MNKENLQQVIKAAKDLNFWGKRKLDSKLEVVEQIAKDLDLKETGKKLVELLEKNEPEKPTKAKKKAASNKPAADTMTGNEVAQRNNLPVIGGTRFIVTAVQNNTCPASVWPKLLNMAEQLSAQVICLPMWYNKNAFSAAKESETERFDNAFNDYMQLDDCWLGYENAVKLMPSAAIVPTAKQPVNSAKNLNTGELVTVVPSPKIQMQTLPRMQTDPIREAWTTSTATQYNYTRSRAGSEAEASHTFGGIFIEIDQFSGNTWVSNMTQGQDGEIIFTTPHLKTYYTQKGVSDFPAMVLGDLHCERYDQAIWDKTLFMLESIEPQIVAVHDILHFETQSHHNRRSGRHNYKMKDRLVIDDLKQVIKQLNQLAELTPCVYVVESNHNSALDTWLDDSTINAKLLGGDQKLYYLLNWLVCDAIDKEDDSNALEIALKAADLSELPNLADNIKWGRMDVPEEWHGYDLSQHGHKGNNGARGNPNQIKQTGLKTITGHTHSPAILCLDNFVVGVTASLNQGYNRGGGSNWQHSDVVVHSNGIPQMLNKNPQSNGYLLD